MLKSGAAAERFLKRVSIALRYGATPGLPLASMYHAAAGPDRDDEGLRHAIAVTNRTMESGAAIEVSVIAGRLSLVHRDLMPALYVLVRRGRAPDDLDGLTLNARAAYRLVREHNETTAGRLRKQLGLAADGQTDPAYQALAELQQAGLVDRGPFEARASGVPYLSRDGYPYHLFHVVHGDLVKQAKKVSVVGAATEFLRRYLDPATFCHVSKMKSMFRQFLRTEEIDAALAALVAQGAVILAGKGRAGVAVTCRRN